MANGFERYAKKTRRAEFLEEMELVVPWAELVALVEPHYPKAAAGGVRWEWSGCCGFTSCSSGSTVSVQSESTYNWKTEKWSGSVNAAVSKLVELGKVPVSLQAGVGYWAESPETGPEGFRYRFQATFVLPKFL
jgi:hypothetical protein